ncbi:MAG TPA: alpha-L-rhamnosidase C-terminal domain-containing protein [Saprospiraceae bacterium]|nr:alpha-L-rhamnosidase C-terminal domain-containing protein [Saprospiraceae bacterium]
MNKNRVYDTLRLMIFLLILSGITSPMGGQSVPDSLLQKRWAANWVSVPGTDTKAYGVYLFRKTIDLSVVPDRFPVYVSADNRYKLYVNGELVSLGPARGDLFHWNFEQIDLASYLRNGKNIIAAKVWNEAELRPEAQVSYQTGFILQGGNRAAEILNTDDSWKCIQDKSYAPVRVVPSWASGEVKVYGYYVAGPGEQIDLRQHIRDWQQLDFDDQPWTNARMMGGGLPKYTVGLDGTNSWRLVPSPLPQMEMTDQRMEILPAAEGVEVPVGFPKEKIALRIPANTRVTLLLDQTFLTNAYFNLRCSGGAGSTLRIIYAEALNEKDSPQKGNRNEIAGKEIVGRQDILLPDGSDDQSFTTLAYRTYRYVQLEIETAADPLVLEDVYGTFTGYPFERTARLDNASPEMDKILDIGWRTARLCATETYMDCPYYEQLQYIGDTRIQAMVSLYNSGDDRLVKYALELMDISRQPEGVTLSRYPSVNRQIIPTFSLWYIGMLHDYMMYAADPGFVQQKLAGTRQVLDYFFAYQAKDGSINHLPNWFYTDWVAKWQRGMPPLGENGSSAILDLQLLIAFQHALGLEQELGMDSYVALYSEKIRQLSQTIQEKYWDESRQLFADTPEKNEFSQHANALAILAGLLHGERAQDVGRTLLSDNTLTPASIYFKYYLHLALVKVGLGNDYLDWLGTWRKNMELGLTTWAESLNREYTRSDCHAWGSSPNVEFFRVILGIDSAAPGFTKVKIQPHLGDIENIGGEMPHPNGMIEVQYQRRGAKLEAQISLPSATTGTFIWQGKEYALKSGNNTFNI